MIKTTSIFLISLLTFFYLPNLALAQGAIDPAFNPNLLITDESFSDVGTFGGFVGIQQFLEKKGSVLANTSPDFLIKLKEPDTNTKVALEDPQPNLGRLRTAAELIYDAATSKGLNPQVLLVILQKEQSLINGTFSNPDTLQRALDRSVGFGCPDDEGCGDIFLGFYSQLFGTFDSSKSRWLGAAASLMRSFKFELNGVRVGRGPSVDSSSQTFGRPTVKTSRKGDTIILDNTLGGYDGVNKNQTVTLTNFATAALYRYTPHVFNGNYNFWKFYIAWFRYPNGTIVKSPTDSNTLYVLHNDTKRQFSAFVATVRKLKTDTVITLSQAEFETYVLDKPLPPLDGTLIMGENGAVYLIHDTVRRPISYQVFIQRKFSFASVIKLPQAEVDGYAIGSFVVPIDGTLVMGTTDPTVYYIDRELKRPVAYDIFIARKFSFAKIMKLSDEETTGIPLGGPMPPPDGVTLQLKGDAGIYWFKDGQKRYVSYFVFNQRKVYSFPHVVLGQTEFDAIPTATPFPPKDGSIIKGDASAAIFKFDKGMRRLLTAVAYKRLRSPKPTILSQSEVDGYQEGDPLN